LLVNVECVFCYFKDENIYVEWIFCCFKDEKCWLMKVRCVFSWNILCLRKVFLKYLLVESVIYFAYWSIVDKWWIFCCYKVENIAVNDETLLMRWIFCCYKDENIALFCLINENIAIKCWIFAD